jgi:D-beta-D-heptose 7-phosphate kinase/D-beta-D-heptose 1-phosphate adenosyltransferase
MIGKRQRTRQSMRERKRFEKILGRFLKVRLLVVGDIMMDRSILGRVSRISPEAPVPVLVVEKEDFTLGGAANVANNILSLGGKVSLCGLLGDDENGKKIHKRLVEKGIKTDGVFFEKGRQTTVKTRIIAHHPHHQQLVRIDRETTDGPKASTLQHLLDFLEKNMEHFEGVIISDYGKGLLKKELIRTVIQQARKLRKYVMVDPKLKNFSYYKGATVVTSNMKEASEKSRIPITGQSSIEKMGRKLLGQLGCDVLVITQGEDGMTIFKAHEESKHIQNAAKEVFDVTGAGDTVIGTMALALGAGAKIIEAANLANLAAGVVVEKRGTSTVNREELIKAIRERF